MNKEEFYKALALEIETQIEISDFTRLADIPSYDSLGALTITLFFDKKFSKIITIESVQHCITANDVFALYQDS